MKKNSAQRIVTYIPRLKKSRLKKTGLPPGSLIHIGEKLTEGTKVSLLHYDEQDYREEEIKDLEVLRAVKSSAHVSWIHIEGIHDTQALERIGVECHDIVNRFSCQDIVDTRLFSVVDS